MFHVTFEVLLTLISILSILRRPDKGICASSDSISTISIWVMRWISGAFDSSLCLLSILNHGVHDPRWCTKNVQYSFCHCDIGMDVECDGALMIGKLSTPLFPLAAASMARKMLEVVVSRS